MAKTAGRGSYERERVKMTAATVERAARMIQEGKLVGRGAEIADADTPGLTLRITRAAGTWYLRHRKGTFRLGSMDALTLPAARLAADRARRDVEAGVNPREDLHVFEAVLAKGKPVELAADAAFAETVEVQSDEDRRRRGPWQWQDLMAEFLAAKLPDLKESYRRSYSAYHAGPEFEPIERLELASIEISDLEELRDRVIESRTLSAAARVVAQCKEALTWGWRSHATRSGLADEKHAWWQERWHIEYSSKAREHTPTIQELVRTLLVIEHHRTLSSTDQETENGMLAAVWAVVLTGQRTGSLGRTRRDGVIPMPDMPGWEVWTWTAKEMKSGRRGGRPHALPIPPAAIAAIDRLGADPSSPWRFPSRVDGKHVTPAGFTGLFHRLEGKTKAGKTRKGKKGPLFKRPHGNLFERYGIRVWTPHDARRTLGTFLDEEQLGGAGSAILAHARDKTENREEARIEDVTRKVYARAQRLKLKASGMAPWIDHVLEHYERERARFKPLPLP